MNDKSIMYLVSALVIMAFPMFLDTAFQTGGNVWSHTLHVVAEGDTTIREYAHNVTPQFVLYLKTNFNEALEMTINIISWICYLLGIFLGVKGMISIGSRTTKNMIEALHLERLIEEPAEKILKIAPKKLEVLSKADKVMQLPSNRTGEHAIDRIIVMIEIKSRALMAHKNIKENIELTLIVQSSLEQYMPKVISAYNDIPINKKKIKGKDARKMTIDQLELILDGLDEIEDSMLATSYDKLRVNEKIINSMFKKSEYELEA